MNWIKYALLISLLATLTGCGPLKLTSDKPKAGELQAADRDAFDAAMTAMRVGDDATAKLILDEMNRRYDNVPAVHANLGIIALRADDLTMAESEMKLALDLRDKSAAIHNQLGVVYRNQGRFDEALAEYQRAIELKKSYAEAYLNIAILNDLYYRQGTEAINWYQQYLELHGEDAKISAWIADLQRRVEAGELP